MVLLKGRAVATLVSDRSAPFYLLSVYLHQDHVKKEIEDILNAWRNVEKKSDRVVIAGDFNHADVKCPLVWKRWVTTCKVIDVHPSLATYLHAGGISALDRCLVPEDWVSTARWNPEIRILHTSQTNGRKILKLSVRARPTVLNNPRDVKHETIPTGVFMPGKDGHATKDNRSLNRLVRLLHRTHHDLFDGLPCPNGFRVASQEGMDLPISVIHYRCLLWL